MAEFSSMKCIRMKVDGLTNSELMELKEFLRTNVIRPGETTLVENNGTCHFSATFHPDHYKAFEKWLIDNGHSQREEVAA